MPRKKVSPPDVEVKKPSLAALKSTDKKSVTAKRKAVQKIETATVQKVAEKKTVRKARSVTIIDVPKKSTTKKNATSKGIGKQKEESTAKASFFTGTSSITLPTNMSIRAKEKALVLLEQMTKDFAQSAQQISYIAGICFILLGATVSVSFSGSLFSPNDQTAALAGTTSSSTSADAPSVPMLAIPAAQVTLLDPLPVEVISITEHKLAAVHTKSVGVRARSLTTGKVVPLSVVSKSSDLYTFKIDNTLTEPGTYEVVAIAESALQDRIFEYRLGTFVVVSPVASSTSTTGSPLASTTIKMPEATAAPTSTAPALTSVSSSTNTDITQAEKVPPDALVTPILRLRLPSGDLRGETIFTIEASADVMFVELYARPVRTSDPRYIGRAVKRADMWYYFLNTKNLPNGEYSIYARTRVSNKEIISENIRKTIFNQPSGQVASEPLRQEEEVNEVSPAALIASPTQSSPVEETEIAEEAEMPTQQTLNSARSLPNVSIEEAAPRESDAGPIMSDPVLIQETLLAYDKNIRELFNRYSVARQAGDDLIMRLAEEEVEAGKKAILDNVLLDASLAIYVGDITTALDEQFVALKKQVDTFEELRRTASDNATAIDTDSDGISDFDEENLYRTDPAAADTDSDGVLDGVEIMRGFDPKNAVPEAVITYESPKDVVALVQENILTVAAVVPVITEEVEVGKVVLAEIRGTGLPNSFVTLYIFSTPTIVTVRTDDTGAFVYRFERELEDGEHEVYAAITDNTGAIVARSNPFRFVKQAEAFTVAGANDSALVSEMIEDSSSLTNPYNVAGGMGILALGLILLMLGITMREQNSLKESSAHGVATS